MLSSVFDLGPQGCQALTLLTYRCHWGKLVVTLLVLSSMEKVGDIIEISEGSAFSRPKASARDPARIFHSGFRKLRQIPSSPSWESKMKSRHLCPSLASCSSNNGNVTIGCFLIMWTAIWNFSNISHAWFMLFTFRGTRLFYDEGWGGGQTVLESASNNAETQCQLFCPSSPYDSSLPSAWWLLDGPVLSETRTNAVKSQGAKCAGSFPQPIVSRLRLWMKGMWLTFKCTKDCRSPVQRLSFHKELFVLFWIN